MSKLQDHDRLSQRLALILHKLANDERPTAEELAEEFGVSLRTIQRDIGQRLHIFPIEKDSIGRYRFMEGFGLDKSVLRDEEILLVMLGLSQIEGIGDGVKHAVDTIVRKLVVPGLHSPYYIKPEIYEPFDMDSPAANLLEEAIAKSRLVTFDYRGKERTVEPYRIASFDGLWYLFARDTETEKIRTYQAAAIRSPKLRQQTYDAPDIASVLEHVHSAWFEDGSCFTVTLRVAPPIADYFRRKKHLSTQRIAEELPDGSLLVTFEVSHEEDIDNLIKAWLPHIEIVSPLSMRNRLVEELKDYLERMATVRHEAVAGRKPHRSEESR